MLSVARPRARSLTEPRVHHLYLHAVAPSHESSFRRLLEWLAATGHTFLSYSEAIDRTVTGNIDRAYVTFSFDDGYASNARTAALLQEYGAAACFFVVTDFVGLVDLDRARAFLGRGLDEPAMTWDEVAALTEHHEVGNHTRGHKVLSRLSAMEAEEEVGAAAEELRRRLGDVQHFAWPLGRFRHFDKAARDTVFETGHASCASAERGAHGPAGAIEPRALCVRRDHLMAEWPLHHQKYFIARSAADRLGQSTWPSGWGVS